MLLKGLGILIILAASVLFGYSLSRDYVMRIKNLEQVDKMFLLLKGEIKYNNSGINESVMKISGCMENIMGEFLKCVWSYFNNEDCTLKDAWNEGVKAVLETKTKLGKEDIVLIKELGNSLGITDRETQINGILNCMGTIEIKIKELNEVREEKCRLYRTLGVMTGAFMAIVLI